MFRLVLKRLVRFIPAFFIIAFAGFLLTNSIPGDPVERILVQRYGAGLQNKLLTENNLRKKLYCDLGLDQPSFYFTLNSYAQSDTLYRIVDPQLRKSGERFCYQYGCTEQVEHYLNWLGNHPSLRSLYIIQDVETAKNVLLKHPAASAQIKTIGNKLLDEISSNKSGWKCYIPTIHFNGLNNRFHTWMFGGTPEQKGLLRGDFGLSYQTGERVNETIWTPLGYSLELILIAMLLAFATGIPLGFYLHRKQSKWRLGALQLFYALPGFLLGTLLIFFFANRGMFYWFPESGLYPTGYVAAEHGLFENWTNALPYMCLPILTLAMGTFSFVSKLTAELSQQEYQKNYIQTALAKGMSKRNIDYKQVLRNIGIPLVTVWVQVLPAAVGGTLVVEMIFQYPGLGKTVYDAVIDKDYPVIIAAFTLSGLLTLLAYLIADVLYLLIDPRTNAKP